MGKPRMIILIRHAQSEGNKNRDIHQFIPDHRVKLTPHGITQAEEAGRQLRSLLKPDDTIQFFTSPYRRTRETTEGILRTLTSDDPTPSPFPRNKIKVFEEPRLREQDFGNFQPCSAEMERMWQERADYGHFFYRIPDGESAADAYDRISGFNESLWRQFGDEDFPSVCVLVTHGMMTRVFLMKWYHWSVEYFEDLRNINHCEFIKMKRSENSGRYILENELRTWSDLKRRAAAEGGSSTNRPAPGAGQLNSTPSIPIRRWGGCINGCNHDKQNWPKRPMRKNTMEYQSPLKETQPPPAAQPLEKDESTNNESKHTPSIEEPSPARLARKQSTKTIPEALASPNDASNDTSSSETEDVTGTSLPRTNSSHLPRTAAIARHLAPPQRTTGDGFSDDSDYFPGMQHLHGHHRSKLRASSKQRQQSKERKLARRQTEKEWKEESGMGIGRRADTLGDGSNGTSDEAGLSRVVSSRENAGDGEDGGVEVNGGESGEAGGMQGPILKEALKGDMIVEHSEEERDKNGENRPGEARLGKEEIERMEEKEKKGLGEVY